MKLDILSVQKKSTPLSLLYKSVSSTTPYVFTLVVVLFLGMLFSSSVMAQDEEWKDDPLEKPVLWEKLVENPTDSVLWANYVGKDWASMSLKEAERVNSWKQELMLQKLAQNEAVVGFVISEDSNEGFFIDEAAFREFEEQIKSAKASGNATSITIADIQGLEAIVMPEWEGMEELKGNISENFVILEDIYRDIFEEQGLEFRDYESTHPDGSFSKITWINELDGQLMKAKQKQLAELKKKYKITNVEEKAEE